MIGLSQSAARHYMQPEVPKGGGDGEAALGSLDCALVFACPPELARILRTLIHHPVNFARGRYFAQVSQIGERLASHLTPEGVMNQPVTILSQPISIEVFD